MFTWARLAIFVAVGITFSYARAPLESYKRYMIVMVHGIGANTMQPHDYDVPGPETDAPRKSAIFDKSTDDNRPVFDAFSNDKNWQGNLAGTLQSRGFLGHTVWYDFYEPWQSPIYGNDEEHKYSLSRYLGDRSLNSNPMGEKQVRDRYLFNGERYSRKNELPAYAFPSFYSVEESEEFFGQTAQSYWLHNFFPDKLDDHHKVEYKGFSGPFLSLAQKDWSLWNRLRYGESARDDDVPKKYILIAHSMGGLTTRDYITGPFYKGDVDKLITLDSPHEGSAIANYVQYWHRNKSWSKALDEKGGEGFFEIIDYLNTIVSIANLTAICLSEDYKRDYGAIMTIRSILLLPMTIHSLSANVAASQNDYSKNEEGTGKPYTKRGIDVMTLRDGKETAGNSNDFLKTFNKREKVQDYYRNEYSLPFFRLVSTSGVPTPGGWGMHQAMSIPYANAAAILAGIWPAFVGENGGPGEVSAAYLRIATAFGMQSLWNDWGSGFVPTWSARADNVLVFNRSEGDTRKINIPFLKSDEIKDDGFSDWAVTIGLVTGLEIAASFIPSDNCAWKALRYFAFGAAAVLPLMINKDANLARLFDYVGFHGAMVKRVDSDQASDAPTGRGADKKIIDELLWERPSVSFVYHPLSAWDYSLGGYVGIGTNREKIFLSEKNPGVSTLVKWNGEEAAHIFEMDFTKVVVPEGETESEELIRRRTVYVAGSIAGSRLSGITLVDEEGAESVLNMSQCENVTGFIQEDSEWMVTKDNEGVLKCDTKLPKETNGSYTLKIEAYHPDGKGALLVNIGKEPGRAFIPNGLLKAQGVDWERYLTFKNRRPQRKNSTNGIPTEDHLDRTVAEMVDYHRSPLLVVNTLPRYFEIEIDELQPDRMNKLAFSFNFGTASITYEAVNDPNQFNQIPDGFTNKPDGFADPSKEEYTVTVQLGATRKQVTVKNPINEWGRMILDFDELETVLNMNQGTLQPFLEGRNHLRVYSENRWQMNRVQEINLFIPGPPPAVTPIFPMADEAFCGSSYLEFETDLIYNQSSTLLESDISISCTDANGVSQAISGLDISKVTGSNTKYRVKTKAMVDWPPQETGVQITVTPRINGSPSNPVNYQYRIYQDCIAPAVSFAGDQQIFNPTAIRFDVFDLEAADGDQKAVQDLLVELQTMEKTPVALLSAEKFSGAGAKVRNPVWKDEQGAILYADGRYRLVVRAHDNTIKDNESDIQRKAFWESYGEDSIPDLTLPFAAYCNGIDCMTQWGRAETEIVLDFTPPVISSLQYIPAVQADGILVYAGEAVNNPLSLKISVTDDLSDTENPPQAMLEMYPVDALGNELTDGSPAFKELTLQTAFPPRFDFDATVITAHDAFTRSLTGGAQTFIEGIYQSKIVVKDMAGNETISPATTIIVDMTAPRILNANVPYSPLPGSEHIIRFSVDELADAAPLRAQSTAAISTSVSLVCVQGTLADYSLNKREEQDGGVYYEYTTILPEGLQGECLVTIKATDARGNVRRSDNKIVVDLMPPEITSPATGADVAGRVAIHGVADDPSLNSGAGFAWYALSYAPIDEDGNLEGLWKTTGITVPDAQQCSSEPNRGCRPVSRSGKSNVLGYWDTRLLGLEERGRVYRLKLTVTDNFTTLDHSVDIFVPEQEAAVPTIAFDDLPATVDFSTGISLPISWNISAPPSNKGYQARLEISRLNENQEKITTVVNRLFEGVIPEIFYGEPANASVRGVYVWLNALEQVTGATRYRVRLVAGEKETKFQLSFMGSAGAELAVAGANGEASPEGVVILKNGLETVGSTAAIARTLAAGSSEEFILSTNSKVGIDWVLNANYLQFEGGNYQGQNLVPLYAPNVAAEYAYIGQSKLGIGSAEGLFQVRLPSLAGGKSFDWKGVTDGSGANVPSGAYRIRATLEGLNDRLTAVVESIVEVTGAPVNITESRAVPDQVQFGPVLPQVTLSFKIDQDALVSVFVRSRDGGAPTDLRETMLLSLDGQNLKLEKQLLAGRNTAYTVNWNGVYGDNRLLTPNANGYEFVIQAYALSGKIMEKEITVPFEVIPQGMTEDASNVILLVDGDDSRRVEYGGVSYQLARGLNDLVIEAAPHGYRVVRDNVNVQLGYKGTQTVPTLPYERYSIGVQIHKKSIEFWAVTAVTFQYIYETENVCNEKTRTTRQVKYTSVRFAENNADQTVKMELDFNEGRGSDMGGKMNQSNVHLLLIPKAVMTETQLKTLIKAVNDMDDVSDKNTEWNRIKNASELDFLWVPQNVGTIFVESAEEIGGLPSSGRQSLSSWRTENHGTLPRINSTQIAWHSGCDVGSSQSQCLSEGSTVLPDPADPARGNGIYDPGEPTLFEGEPFNPDRHQPEVEIKAWAWKHTDGESKEYDREWSCLGCTGCRHDLRYLFEIVPTRRFWANPNHTHESMRASDYGWNNAVNRYVTLDPLNRAFLFDVGQPFHSIKTPFINPNSGAVVYDLNNPDPETDFSQFFLRLLHSFNFQGYQSGSSQDGVSYSGSLASDVEMILHFFKKDPSSRKYYPARFTIEALIDDDRVYSSAFSLTDPNDSETLYSSSISVGGLRASRTLKVSVKMDPGQLPAVAPTDAIQWPISQAELATIQTSQCNGLCGDEESDREIDISEAEGVDASHIDHQGFRRFEIPVRMGRLADNSSGFDLSPYIRKSGTSYYRIQGDDPQITIAKETVTITDMAEMQVPSGYYVDDHRILRRTGAEAGFPYVAAADPLMAKMDDDGDGLVAEDGGKDRVDGDGDLALDEDPAEAVRLRVPGIFPFVSGASSPLLLNYSLMNLIGAKADAQGVVPGSSEASGWSILEKPAGRWKDSEHLLTRWEESNDPSAFAQTRLFYKDGLPHQDVKIHSAQGMDDVDAGQAVLYLAPASFDSSDRRILEIRGDMPWKRGDTYRIFASSDAGWTDLTPEPPRMPPTGATRLTGTLAYWDVKTSGFHQLLLLRTAGEARYYKVFAVAIGSENAGNGTFSDALGRAQVTTGNETDFVDVVPLGSHEVPQAIPGDASMGPVVMVYPPVARTQRDLTLRIRYTKEEISQQGWTEDASIYVVSEGYSPQRLSAVTWAFYDLQNNRMESATLAASGWEYAVISGVLPARISAADTGETLQTSLGETSSLDLTSGTHTITVQEKTQDAFTVIIDQITDHPENP